MNSQENELAWEKWLPPLQKRWMRSVNDEGNGEPLPWYLETRQQQGAFATFLGLVMDSSEDLAGPVWNWQALAVGDSCLFHTRKDKLLQAFPVIKASDFGNSPWLVGSRTSPYDVPRKQGLFQAGQAWVKDQLWLMTDALALWFLFQLENGQKPWKVLDQVLQVRSPEESFSQWVHDLRETRKIRNDDVTLMLITVDG